MLITTNIEQYLQKILIPVRLACTTPSGWPFVLSLWYLYQDGKIYCATQKSAKIITYLQHNPRVAFEIAADEPPYCGLRGQGLVTLAEHLGAPILSQLLQRYEGSTDTPLAQRLLKQQANEIALIITPQTLFQWNFAQRMSGSRTQPCP